jgi:hypothetical protein
VSTHFGAGATCASANPCQIENLRQWKTLSNSNFCWSPRLLYSAKPLCVKFKNLILPNSAELVYNIIYQLGETMNKFAPPEGPAELPDWMRWFRKQQKSNLESVG